MHAAPANACQWDLTYEHGHENRPLTGHFTGCFFYVDIDNSRQTLLLLEITAFNRTQNTTSLSLLVLRMGAAWWDLQAWIKCFIDTNWHPRLLRKVALFCVFPPVYHATIHS